MESESARILKNAILSRTVRGNRFMVGIAGAPASGKSTLAEKLVELLNSCTEVEGAALFPMDGFHLDNDTLQEMDLLTRKGSPPTFDVKSYEETLMRLRSGNEDVMIPLFDRSKDAVVSDALKIGKEVQIVVSEGNYLLLDLDPWRSLADIFDFTVYLQVKEDILKTRLMNRWLGQGMGHSTALEKTLNNDLPNARLVIENLISPTLKIVLST